MTVVGFLKQNWMLIAGALIVIALVMIFMSMKKEKYYDYEMAGCSTCSAGDAGVFDYEEMYQMPDDYYSDEADAEDDEIYEDDTFAGDDETDLNLTEDVSFDDDDTYDTGDNDAEDSIVLYNDDTDGYDAQGEAMAVANDILATGFDEEEAGMDADMVFAEELMDGGMDGEEDVDMLEIDELDNEEEDYSEL
jgi:hypothetical protein